MCRGFSRIVTIFGTLFFVFANEIWLEVIFFFFSSTLGIEHLENVDDFWCVAIGGSGFRVFSFWVFWSPLPPPQNFKFKTGNFHNGAIVGMDICIRKPLLVTCGEDQTIRLWNYVSKILELTKYFPHPIKSIAFHPSGLHLLVGFSDKLKLMNILMDDITISKDFHVIRGCHK